MSNPRNNTPAPVSVGNSRESQTEPAASGLAETGAPYPYRNIDRCIICGATGFPKEHDLTNRCEFCSGRMNADYFVLGENPRENFIYWLDRLLERAIPDNFEEYTAKQLRDYAYEVIFDAMDEEGLAPPVECEG